MKNNQGFTLLEMMIVVALIAIIATLAVPSLQVFIQRSQVAEQMKEFAQFLQESRSQAVLLRANEYTATIGSVAGGAPAEYPNKERKGKPDPSNPGKIIIESPKSTWSANTNRVNLRPTTAVTYSLMGDTNQETCYIMTHTKNPTVGEVLILDRNGNIKIHKNKIDCNF